MTNSQDMRNFQEQNDLDRDDKFILLQLFIRAHRAESNIQALEKQIAYYENKYPAKNGFRLAALDLAIQEYIGHLKNEVNAEKEFLNHVVTKYSSFSDKHSAFRELPQNTQERN